MTNKYEGPMMSAQPVSRLGLYLPTGLFLLVTALWTGFWFYSVSRVEQSIDAWRTSEATAGRSWTCSDRTSGGYPFRVEVTCSKFLLQLSGGRQISLGSVHAVTQIYSPKLILADVEGPLQVQENGLTTEARWDRLRLSVRVSGEVERISAFVSKAEIPTAKTILGEGEFHIRKNGERVDSAIDFFLRLKDVRSEQIDFVTETNAPATLELQGILTQGLNAKGPDLKSILEQWQASKGRLIVEQSTMTKGDLRAEGTGEVGLDASRRPEGTMNLRATGLGRVIGKSFGANAGQIATALLERKEGPTPVTIRLNEGRLILGPLRSPAVLPSLY